ncbi:MAG TPA: branched-chain amino acid ABC transporter permease [Rhodobacteraceae bacterium]|jgi:branched-chain amino acid transport system permease protein|nr:branched-chain amino acid ABC transporter permease [Paracoccaceae bacterium]
MDRGVLIGGIIFGLLLAMPVILPIVGANYLSGLLIKAMLLAIAALSLDLIIGHGGMVSLGHAAFIGIGAYATAISLENGIEEILLLFLIALGATASIALVTGVLALRTSGVYFLMITLAFGQMTFFTLTSLAAYGGDDGLTLWSLATLFGSDIVQEGEGLYFFVLVILIFTWIGVWRISRSRFGRVLKAARDNPKRAEVMGYPVARYQLIAYVIAACIAGISGLLLVQYAEFVSPSIAAWQRSGDLIVAIVLGGLGSRNGAILGAFFIVIMEEFLSSIFHEWRLIYGPLLVLLVLYAKGGLSDLILPKSSGGGA